MRSITILVAVLLLSLQQSFAENEALPSSDPAPQTVPAPAPETSPLPATTAAPVTVSAPVPSPSPEGAKVYFIEPADGATVPATFTVKFGLTGMGVAPASVKLTNTGHHHLLIDLETLPDMTASLPATKNIRHFGGGQTETTLTLPAGTHTLQLLLGDHQHRPHDKPVLSDKITVTVVE